MSSALLVACGSSSGASVGSADSGGDSASAASHDTGTTLSADGATDAASEAHSPEADAGTAPADASSTDASATIADDASPATDGASPADAASPPDSGATLPGWTLTWSDEFDGDNGSAPDATKWAHDLGGSGWGNDEREFYTDGNANSFLQDGQLIIEADQDTSGKNSCWYGTCQYTSARILTDSTFTQQNGRFEAMIQIPKGQGMWPAFWLIGDNIATVDWPTCGEIDIMENIGKEPGTVHGTVHGPGYEDEGIGAPYALPSGAFSDGPHLFAVEWSDAQILFYVDSTLYETINKTDLTSGETWVFDHPFFIIMNVAVGGTWPGDPDATSTFPQQMKVDYVRVYAKI